MKNNKNRNIYYTETDYFYDYEFQEEQKRLEKYIIGRSLPRPKTTRTTVILLILTQLLLSLLMANIFNYCFRVENFKWLVYLISFLFFGIIFLKIICIKSIECYQHYAKEETRRRCLCVPSCSEYSIAVLKKYNVFKALNKIRIRLFKTCGGLGFVHDEP